jgi:hypothetical protein
MKFDKLNIRKWKLSPFVTFAQLNQIIISIYMDMQILKVGLNAST